LWVSWLGVLDPEISNLFNCTFSVAVWKQKKIPCRCFCFVLGDQTQVSNMLSSSPITLIGVCCTLSPTEFFLKTNESSLINITGTVHCSLSEKPTCLKGLWTWKGLRLTQFVIFKLSHNFFL
jgi:hypothetical protein